jgi:hypothetical protein
MVESMEKVKAIREWAQANYEKGGSFIIETMNDSDILAEFKSLNAAKKYAKAMLAQEFEVRNA